MTGVFLCAVLLAAVPASPPEIRVAAAADLAPAQAEIGSAFLNDTGIRVVFVTGSSGILTRQIEHGAPFDVFLSANEGFVQTLAGKGRIDPGSVRTYATGRLGWISAKRAAIPSLDQLARARYIAIPNPAHAPYGVAVKEALTALNLWAIAEKKIVYAENARQAFAYTESGNADLAVTAWTVLKAQGGTSIDPKLHAPIRQGAGIVATSRQQAAARKFVDFLLSPRGQAILLKAGLGPP